MSNGIRHIFTPRFLASCHFSIVSLCHAHRNDAIVEISLTFTRQAEPDGTGGILNDRETATSQVEFI